MREPTGNTKKEQAVRKKNQLEMQGLKRVIVDIKNSVDGLNNKMDLTDKDVERSDQQSSPEAWGGNREMDVREEK